MSENETPCHDEALSALAKIRAATRAADLADAVEFKRKREYKEAREAAKNLNFLARSVARAMTRPLPLFDEADGLTPGEAPRESAKDAINAQFAPALFGQGTPISELTAPVEVLDALKAMGFKTVGTLLAFRDAGCSWTIVPGIDEAGAGRLDTALSDAAAKALGLNLPAETETGDDAGRDAA